MLDRLDAALSSTAGTAFLLLAAWLLLSLLAAVSLRLTAGSAARRTRRVLDGALRLLAPGLAGRALRTAVGLGALGTAVFSGAFAAGVTPLASAVAQAAVPPTIAPALSGPAPAAAGPRSTLPAPPRPVVANSRQPADDLWPLSPRRTPASRGRGENSARSPVVVLRGDTLWGIAARHLPVGASNASIDAAWRRWFDVNRAVVGPDPNLLKPGQVLLSPAHVAGVPG